MVLKTEIRNFLNNADDSKKRPGWYGFPSFLTGSLREKKQDDQLKFEAQLNLVIADLFAGHIWPFEENFCKQSTFLFAKDVDRISFIKLKSSFPDFF